MLSAFVHVLVLLLPPGLDDVSPAAIIVVDFEFESPSYWKFSRFCSLPRIFLASRRRFFHAACICTLQLLLLELVVEVKSQQQLKTRTARQLFLSTQLPYPSLPCYSAARPLHCNGASRSFYSTGPAQLSAGARSLLVENVFEAPFKLYNCALNVYNIQMLFDMSL